MNLDELFNKKRRGDVALVAEIIGESLNNTGKILRDKKKKKHSEAVTTLERIIANRDNLMSDNKSTEEEK